MKTQSKRRTKAVAFTVTGVLALAVTMAGQCQEDTTGLVGTWGGKWRTGGRTEVRITSVSQDGPIEGTLCWERRRDGSYFVMDFSLYETSFDGKTLRIRRASRRGTRRYTFRARSGGIEFKYQNTGGRESRLPLKAGETECIHRVYPIGEEAPGTTEQEQQSGFTGLWTSPRSDPEVRIFEADKGGVRGTACAIRRDGSIEFFDFGPKRKIKPEVNGNRIEIHRKPFDRTVIHVLEQKDDGAALVYRERVKNKPEHARTDMHRGLSDDGCLIRIAEGG